jgi:beta-adrenergic-receptor kinase
MDDHGFTRISDLGLACKVPSNGLAGACGTRGYWAPEMIKRDADGRRMRYNLSVDWFSFGCVIYEFLIGVSPFRTEIAKKWGGVTTKADRDKAIDQATLEMEPEFESDFDPAAKDLCAKLLEKDPHRRLGAGGAAEVMAHPFFSEINWLDFKYGKLPPPMVPTKDLNMASQSEIGMFNDDKQSRKVDLTDADHEIFDNWNFVNKTAFQEEVVGFLRYEEVNVGSFFLTFYTKSHFVLGSS